MVKVPDVRDRAFDLPDGRVHYVESGSGDALILVHGGHGSWTHWIANIDAAARRRRVLAVDLPGFGGSFNPKPAYSIDQYAGVVSAMLDALQIERAAIAGFSFGCVVSAHAAVAEPARITHLAMVNPPGIGPPSPVAAKIMQALSSRSVKEGLRAGALGSLQQVQLFNQELIDDHVVDLMVANVRQTRFVSRTLSRGSGLCTVLENVSQPLLMVLGREDLHRKHSLAETLAAVPKSVPQAEIHIVESARHWLQFDRAELFDRLLAEFIG